MIPVLLLAASLTWSVAWTYAFWCIDTWRREPEFWEMMGDIMTESLLARHGWTVEEFDEHLRRIARGDSWDPRAVGKEER